MTFPEAYLGVADKREAVQMYESFEQFTSSPADQRIEEVQYVLRPTSHLQGYSFLQARTSSKCLILVFQL